MRQRRFAAFIAIAVSPLLLMPIGYYCFFAYVRHEHFYHGFPTSYWARAIKRWDPRASRTQSVVPYLDTVLTYLGFLGEPAILAMEPDSEALPVLLDLAVSDDAEVQSQAVVTLATRYGQFPFWEGGIGKRYGNQSMLACGGALGDTTYHLFLVDSNGRLLDNLSCSIESRLTRWWYHGEFRVDILAEVEQDGADIVV